jgi:anti-sigma-K factor RskA
MTREILTPRERADEYVLGLLEPREAELIEAEIERDPELALAVSMSRDRFLELDMAGEAMPVSEALWARIDAAVGRGDNVAEPAKAKPANDNTGSFWRRTAFASMAASLLLAVGLFASVLLRPEPTVVAILLDDAGDPMVLVEDFGDRSARVTPLGDFSPPSDRALQVWTLPSPEMGPVSLGLLDGWHSAVLDGPTLPQPHEAQLYEITLEQPGGSTTGRPTGPILVKGFAKIPR